MIHFNFSILLQENSVISGQTPQPGNGNGHGVSRPGSISRASAFAGGETNSNAYATINKLPLVTTASRRRSLLGMAIPVVEFLREGYKIRKIFG
jgi:hypothetical protein